MRRMRTWSGARPASPTSTFAKKFAEAIHTKFPGKMLAYNCSPSFNWKKNLDDATIAKFQRELGAMGYKYQFITLAGFHALNYRCSTSRRDTRRDSMSGLRRAAGARVRGAESGYTACQAPAGSGHRLLRRRDAGDPGRASSTTAMKGSTEEEQFQPALRERDGAPVKIEAGGLTQPSAPIRRRDLRSVLHGLPASRAFLAEGREEYPTITAHRSHRSAIPTRG